MRCSRLSDEESWLIDELGEGEGDTEAAAALVLVCVLKGVPVLVKLGDPVSVRELVPDLVEEPVTVCADEAADTDEEELGDDCDRNTKAAAALADTGGEELGDCDCTVTEEGGG